MAVDEIVEIAVVRFAKENMSHIDSREYLLRMGLHIEDFDQIHLVEEYTDNNKGNIHRTKLELAKRSMRESCEYVGDIDYTIKCIAATGLRRKKK